jgi:hypothetical protein
MLIFTRSGGHLSKLDIARDIFGFDKQFADAGYHRLEPSTEWKEAA